MLRFGVGLWLGTAPTACLNSNTDSRMYIYISVKKIVVAPIIN